MLRRGSGRCRLRLRCRSARAAGRRLRDARGYANRSRLSFHNGAWRRHRDVRQWGRCILGKRACAHRAQRQPTRATDLKRSSVLDSHCSRFLMPLNCDGLISICLLRGPFVAWRSLKEASIDRSGNGRSAGLERQPAGAEMRELGIGELIQQFDRLRQQQQRRG